jgi:hypothetical protein
MSSAQRAPAASSDQAERLPFLQSNSFVASIVVVSAVAFGLALVTGSSATLPVLVAGAFLFVVLLVGNGSWIVHALLVVLFITRPQGVAYGFRLSGYFIYFSEILVAGSLIYAVYLIRGSPATARRLRATVGMRAAILFAVVIAFGVIVGVVRGNIFYDIQYDVRPISTMAVTMFVVAVIVAMDDWRPYVKTIAAILSFSAILTIYASVTGLRLGGRTETAQLYAKGGKALAGDSDAVRYLTDATPLALAVFLGCAALLFLGRVSATRILPLLIPAMVISFLSFSRNTILALAGALAFTLIIGLLRGHIAALSLRFVRIIVTVAVAVFGILLVSQALGVENWIQTQVAGYAGRVIAGLDESSQKEDNSTLYRLQEDRYIQASGAENPILGGGFGKRYKPPTGERGSFYAVGGQLYAHNAYGWLYVKVGIVGVATFVMLLAAATLPALSRFPPNPLLSAAAATLVGLSIIMVVVPMPVDHGNAPLLGLVIGTCIGAGALKGPKSEVSKSEDGLDVIPVRVAPRLGRMAQR